MDGMKEEERSSLSRELKNGVYKRDLSHNYFVLKNCRQDAASGSACRMIRENRLKTLLPLEIRYEDGDKNFCYEISSMQSLKRIYENKNMSGGQLKSLFREISKMFDELNEYLLGEDGVVLSPDYIFIGPESGETRFLYFPFQEQGGRAADLFSELSEFLLDHIDNQDGQAVVLAYRFYKMVRNENFVVSEIKKLCEKEESVFEAQERIPAGWQGGGGMPGGMQAGCLDGDDVRDRKRVKWQDGNGFLDVMGLVADRSVEAETGQGKGIVEKIKNKIPLSAVVFLLTALVSSGFFLLNGAPVNSSPKLISLGFAVFGICGLVFALKNKRESVDGSGMEADSGRVKAFYKENTGMPEETVYSENDAVQEKGSYMKDGVPAEKNSNMKSNVMPAEKGSFMKSNAVPEKDFFLESREDTAYGKTMVFMNEPEEEERVLVEQKHGHEKTYPINTVPFTIGKMKNMVDLAFSDASVSRIHARIFEEEGFLYITDLGSTNGTYLNGVSVHQEEKLQLEAGDEIRIGKVELIYR